MSSSKARIIIYFTQRIHILVNSRCYAFLKERLSYHTSTRFCAKANNSALGSLMVLKKSSTIYIYSILICYWRHLDRFLLAVDAVRGVRGVNLWFLDLLSQQVQSAFLLDFLAEVCLQCSESMVVKY